MLTIPSETTHHTCDGATRLGPNDLRGVDLSGRPLALVDAAHKPMKELI